MKISSESMSLSIDERTERLKKVGVDDAGGPPVPIPNTEVKPCSAENSALETRCETCSAENSALETRCENRKTPTQASLLANIPP